MVEGGPGGFELGVAETLEEPESTFPPHKPTQEEKRDTTLRYAFAYLNSLDSERIMEGREEKRGAAAIIQKIKNRLNFKDPAIKNLEQIHYIADNEDAWKKLLHLDKGEGKITEKFSAREMEKIEMVARYREVDRYRNEAVKLMREGRSASPERKVEIEGELNKYYAMLLKIAHENSYKVIKEEEKDRHQKIKRLPKESQDDYRQRVKDALLPKRLKDFRVEASDDDDPPALAKVLPIIPLGEERLEQWAKNALGEEGQRGFRSGLEGPIKAEVKGRLADRKLAKELTNTYKILARYKPEDLKGVGIEISKTDSRVVYTEVFKGKKKEYLKEKIKASPTYSITMKVEAGNYHCFEIYSDGVIEDGKRVDRPTKAGVPNENISIRHTAIKYRRPGGDYEPTRIEVNPPLAEDGFDKSVNQLDDLKKKVQKNYEPKKDGGEDAEDPEVAPLDFGEYEDD